MSLNDILLSETEEDEVENLLRAAEEIIEENRSRRNCRTDNSSSFLSSPSLFARSSSSPSDSLIDLIDSSSQVDDDIIYIPNENETNNIETIDLCNTPQTPKVSRRRLADNVVISVTLGSDEFEFPRSRRRRTTPNSASTSSSASRQIFPIAQSSPNSPNKVTNTVSSTDNLNDTSNLLARCPVCLESTINRNPMSTICGHIFCYACITQSINLMKQCPVCKRRITQKNIHKIFF